MTLRICSASPHRRIPQTDAETTTGLENTSEIAYTGDENVVFVGATKASALDTVSSFPEEIQRSAKSFFKGSSNHYDSFSVVQLNDGNYQVKMENPGIVPGSKAVYCKIISPNGKTLRVYKVTYDPDGKIVHTKEKLK